ncbi:MAG TPA: hypothetical protein VGR15_09360 [Bacteroidota bacterium]|jgi:hypothetical protein|nr:hypothetical protein [Bacteroidota bacterium]
MSKSFAYYYYYILAYSPLIPLAFGIRHFRRLTAPTKLFFWYLVISLLLTVIMTVLALQKRNNLWLMNSSQPLYVILLIGMFSLWQKNILVRKIMRASIGLFILVWFFEVIVLQRLFEFTKFAKPTENLILMLGSCITIFALNNAKDRPMIETPQFWIASGVLIYFGGMIMVNLFSSSMFQVSATTLRSVLIPIQPTLNLIAHTFYIGGFLYQCQQVNLSGLSLSAQPSS